jgi:hypothetical protein
MNGNGGGLNKGTAGALALILLWLSMMAFFVAFHPGGLQVNGHAAQNPRDVILWFMQRIAAGTPSGSPTTV